MIVRGSIVRSLITNFYYICNHVVNDEYIIVASDQRHWRKDNFEELKLEDFLNWRVQEALNGNT